MLINSDKSIKFYLFAIQMKQTTTGQDDDVDPTQLNEYTKNQAPFHQRPTFIHIYLHTQLAITQTNDNDDDFGWNVFCNWHCYYSLLGENFSHQFYWVARQPKRLHDAIRNAKERRNDNVTYTSLFLRYSHFYHKQKKCMQFSAILSDQHHFLLLCVYAFFYSLVFIGLRAVIFLIEPLK